MKSEPRYSHLDYQDRQAIAISLEQGLGIRAIGRVLNRSAATISREIARNSGGSGYSCRYAQPRRGRGRRHARPQPKLVAGNRLFEFMAELLRQRWSPQQIAAHLAKLHPSDAAQRASHETIYNVIYAQPRGELRKELIACLRLVPSAGRAPRARIAVDRWRT